MSALTISIEDARENIPKTVTPPIRFARTPENARFFEDIVKMREGVTEGTLDARLRLDRLAEVCAPLAKHAVLEGTRRTDELLTQAIRVSLIGAAACGIAAPGDRRPALLSASLSNGARGRGDSAIRSELWSRTESRHLAQRSDLVAEIRNALGASQGAGEVQTIDAVRAITLVKAAADSWTPDPARPRPEWSGPAAAPLASLGAAVEEQIELLAILAAEVRQRLPRGTGFAETAKAVDQAIEAAQHHGYVRHDDVPMLKQRNAAAAVGARSRELEALEYDLASLSDDAPYERRLAVAARDRGPGLALMRDFLIENDMWLDAGLASAESGSENDANELVTRLAGLTRRWREAAHQGGEG